jgi:hypothetical protein
MMISKLTTLRGNLIQPIFNPSMKDKFIDWENPLQNFVFKQRQGKEKEGHLKNQMEENFKRSYRWIRTHIDKFLVS